MDKKYGVYICTGCGIGDALDIKGISDVAQDEGLAAQTHPFLCGQEGIELLKKDIAEKGVNCLVLAACSRRVNYDVFKFAGCIVDRVNIREGVVWSHPRSEFPALTDEQKQAGTAFDRVQMMAEDYLRMGMARIKKVNLPEPYKQESFTKKILVLGGGVTGMTAALDAAKAGYEVTIVEKTAALGGNSAKWRKQLPLNPPYDTLRPSVVAEKIKEIGRASCRERV